VNACFSDWGTVYHVFCTEEASQVGFKANAELGSIGVLDGSAYLHQIHTFILLVSITANVVNLGVNERLVRP
jgi:hypothetical protein